MLLFLQFELNKSSHLFLKLVKKLVFATELRSIYYDIFQTFFCYSMVYHPIS